MSSAALDGAQPSGSGESPGLVRVELLVTGMTCAACAARVEGRLNAIPLAAAGFLNPLIAGAAMAASSVFVVANSVRLRRFGMPAAGLGPWRRPAASGREERFENGTRPRPGNEAGAREHTASCLE